MAVSEAEAVRALREVIVAVRGRLAVAPVVIVRGLGGARARSIGKRLELSEIEARVLLSAATTLLEAAEQLPQVVAALTPAEERLRTVLREGP